MPSGPGTDAIRGQSQGTAGVGPDIHAGLQMTPCRGALEPWSRIPACTLTRIQMRKPIKSSSPPFSYSSSSSFYPSSLSSYDSKLHIPPVINHALGHSPRDTCGIPSRFIPFLIASAGVSSDCHSSPYRHQDHLESLILKHGYPTPVSLSSLRDLTATSSSCTPPSPPRSRRYRPSGSSPIDAFDSLSLSSTRPIPIPRRPGPIYDEDLPVTPLTGRFDKASYFDDWERASLSAKSRHLVSPRAGRHTRYSSMRSDNSPYYSPVASPTMSPHRPSSPQPSRTRTQNSTKSSTGFNLGSLPRFHPAVYQSSPTSHAVTAQPPSPRQSRQPNYRASAGSRDFKLHYREFLESSHDSPSAPRLDPLRSPGPVTPLALEAGDYLAAGSVSTADRSSRDTSGQHGGPPPDLVDKIIARENEKARQKVRKSNKGR